MLLSVKIAICATILSLYWLIWTPVFLYNLCKFYVKSGEIFIVKRNPKLTFGHSVISFIGFAFYGSLYLVYSSEFNTKVSEIIIIMMNITYPLIAYSFIWGIVLKYYLLSFEINWIKAMHTNSWQAQITESENMTNFYLINKNKYGSVKFALTLLLIILTLSVILCWIVIIIFGAISVIFSVINLLMTIIPTVFVAIFWYMTPQFFDHFYIVQECRILIILGVIYILCYLFVGLCPLFGATAYIRQIVGNVVGSAAYFIVGMHELSFALRKLKSLKHESALNKYIEQSTGNSNKQNVHKIMTNIMSNDIQFDAFIHHLQKEFSIEVGLAYIEIIQFKRLIDTELFPNEDKMATCEQEMCTINNTEIPKSFIVHSKIMTGKELQLNHQHSKVLTLDANNNIDSLHCRKDLLSYQFKAYLLYKKYVATGSQLQINLSHFEVGKLSRQLVNVENRIKLDEEALFSLFNDVLRELWKFMSHACYRFILTSGYEKICQNTP